MVTSELSIFLEIHLQEKLHKFDYGQRLLSVGIWNNLQNRKAICRQVRCQVSDADMDEAQPAVLSVDWECDLPLAFSIASALNPDPLAVSDHPGRSIADQLDDNTKE